MTALYSDILELMKEVLETPDLESFKEFPTHYNLSFPMSEDLTMSKTTFQSRIVDYCNEKDYFLRSVKLRTCCVVDVLDCGFEVKDSLMDTDMTKNFIFAGINVMKGYYDGK